MTHAEKLQAFAALHQKGNPVILYNIWDAGGAKTISDAGAKAIATGSAPIAAAQGFADGEVMPLALTLGIIERIVAATPLPVSADFESGYATDPATITQNVQRVVKTGIVGVNFEDQIIGGTGLYAPQVQAERVQAVRQADANLFINARTDLFLKEADQSQHASLLAEAISRAALYKTAGANGFFAPGLVDAALIKELCAAVDLPVNILKKPGTPTHAELAALGVSRISYGPMAYKRAMSEFAEAFNTL